MEVRLPLRRFRPDRAIALTAEVIAGLLIALALLPIASWLAFAAHIDVAAPAPSRALPADAAAPFARPGWLFADRDCRRMLLKVAPGTQPSPTLRLHLGRLHEGQVFEWTETGCRFQIRMPGSEYLDMSGEPDEPANPNSSAAP